jgi:hypothetical protein
MCKVFGMNKPCPPAKSATNRSIKAPENVYLVHIVISQHAGHAAKPMSSENPL